MEEDLPAKLTELTAKLPIVGNKQTLEQVKKFQKMRILAEDMQLQVSFFKQNYWYYDSSKLVSVFNQMSPAEKKLFDFDVSKVDYVKEGRRMMYGIQRYYLDQDVPPFGSGIRSVLQMNQLNYGHDLRFGLQANTIVRQKDL